MNIVSILVSLSFIAGAVQDYRKNEVSDYTWIPAAIATAVMIYQNIENITLLTTRLVIIASIIVICYIIGGGLADLIGFAFMVVDDDILAPVGSMLIFLFITLPYAIWTLFKRDRNLRIPLKEFMNRRNVYPRKVYFDGKEEELSRIADEAYKRLESLLKEGKDAVVEAEVGLPSIVPMCIGYITNMILYSYFGKPWILILLGLF
ncbi:MAG: hypothetical protein N3F64_06325 [Nitrososphaeria archaeon]|nr:hypothetical protein [Nitrososphaeria archaeon]